MDIDNQILFNENKRLYLKSIRKTSVKVCLILLLMNFLAVVFVFCSNIVLQGLSQDYGIRFSDEILKYLQSYFPCIISEIILIPIGFALLKKEIDMSYFNIFGKKEKSNVEIQDRARFNVLAIFSVFGITFIVTQILSLVINGLDSMGYTLKLPDLDFSDDMIANILALSYSCIIAPILEEIILRGFVLNSFKKYGNMTAIVFSAVAFAMIHMNPVQIPVGFLTGLLLGFVTIKTGNIGLSILIHIANNTLNTIPAEIFGAQNSVSVSFSLVLMIAGACILARFLYLYGREFVSLGRNESKIYAGIGTKLAHTMLTVTSILFIIEWLINNISFIMVSVIKK